MFIRALSCRHGREWTAGESRAGRPALRTGRSRGCARSWTSCAGAPRERVAFKGQVYELPLPGGEGKALRSSAKPRPDIPVYLRDALAARARADREIADGWLGTSFMPDHARHLLRPPRGRRQARGDARWASSIAGVAPSRSCDDVERLVALAEAGSGLHPRRPMGSRQGTTSTTTPSARVLRRSRHRRCAPLARQQRDEAAARVPDEIAPESEPTRHRAMVRERLRVYRGSGLTTLRVDPAGSTLDARGWPRSAG